MIMSACSFSSFQSRGPAFKDKKKTTEFKKDQGTKNKEVIEGIYKRDSRKFRLVRLDRAAQVSITWQLEEELIILTSWFTEKERLTFTG